MVLLDVIEKICLLGLVIMAWFGRGSRGNRALLEDRSNPILESATPGEEAPAQFSEEELVACLYKGSRVTGQLTFHGAARIDGSVEGEVLCHGRLTIGEGAEVRAKIFGDVVVIRGRVEGDVTAKEKVELGAPARLSGNIDAPRLVIGEGVTFDGYCAMGGIRKRREVQNSQSSSSEKAFRGGRPKLATTLEK